MFPKILAGDVGATKTELAVFEKRKLSLKKIHSKLFANKDYGKFEFILEEYLKGNDFNFYAACIGVPAPVFNGKAYATNINWNFNEKKLSELTGINRFSIINDMEALSLAVIEFPKDKFITIYKGDGKKKNGSIAVIAPGTGLGQAAVIKKDGKNIIVTTEGGHVDFAPADEIEIELLKFLLKKYSHVSYEKTSSGIGLLNIFEFLVYSKHGNVSESLKSRLISEDKAAVITDEARKKNKICTKAVEIFISILGRQAGNMVLNYNATGGVYFGGGIPNKISSMFKSGNFVNSFLNKGKLSYMTKSAPVYIVKDPSAGVYGAAIFAMKSFIKT